MTYLEKWKAAEDMRRHAQVTFGFNSYYERTACMIANHWLSLHRKYETFATYEEIPSKSYLIDTIDRRKKEVREDVIE